MLFPRDVKITVLLLAFNFLITWKKKKRYKKKNGVGIVIETDIS